MAWTASPGLVTGRVDDAIVIERSWTDPEAFAELFDRHADEIHRYAAWRLGRHGADDLLAETFAIAFQHRRRYDVPRADARPWLYGIATNLVSRHRRAEARRLRAMSRELPPVEAEPMADRVAAQMTARAAFVRDDGVTVTRVLARVAHGVVDRIGERP